jgi:hypothetical protein
MDRPPVHELGAVNGHSLRFKYRATPALTLTLCRLPSMIFAADLQNLVSASNDFEGRNDRTRARPGAKPLCDRTGDLTKLANFGAPGNMPILACYIFCFVCADPIDPRKSGASMGN